MRWPLVAILVLGGALTIWFVLQCVQYFIQPDELEYLKQSRQIASQLRPLFPGDADYTSWSQLQPLLLAPVWGLIHDTNTAHKAMGVVNALLMTSTAIPAYLLALRVVAERRLAYLVALLTVVIPWMAASATMMTEVAAYPAFLWAVLAVQHAIARPSPRGDLIGVLGVALAYFARPQLAVVAVALVAGIAVQELRYAGAGAVPTARRRERLGPGLRAALVRHGWLLVAVVIALVFYLIEKPDLVGQYGASGVTRNAVNAPGTWMFGRDLLAYVVVGVAVVPLAMAVAWALQTLWRPLTRDQHAFAVMAVITIGLLVAAVGSFTARYTPQGINSRYLFYIAPLLFVGMAALIADRRPATWPLVAGALGVGWLVYGATMTQAGPSLVSPDQTFHAVLIGRSQQIGKALGLPQVSFPHLMAVAAVIVIALLATARRGRWARPVGAAVLVGVTLFCVAETVYSMRKIADTQKGVSPDFVNGRRWIDEAMPAGQRAVVIPSTLGDPGSAYGVWWDVSFWNRTAGQTQVLPNAPDLQQPFPAQFSIAPDGSFRPFGATRHLDSSPYFVRAAGDRTFGLRDAHVIAERFGIQLVKTSSPPRAAWQLAGLLDDAGHAVQGVTAYLLAFPRTPGERTIPVRMAVTAWPDDGGKRVQRYRIGHHRGAVRSGQTDTVSGVARLNPAMGAISLPLRPLGPADATRGIQVLNVWIG